MSRAQEPAWARTQPDALWQPPDLPSAPLPGRELALEMLRRMLLIRGFEERVQRLFREGHIPGTVHLALGQEASETGACLALRSHDRITVTHRGHGQVLAKGADPEAVMAEILGRVTGTSGGYGGSLHVGSPDVGALTGIAMVGSSSPIALGLAFAEQYRGTDAVVLNFFGDGAANKGEIHEAMNMAAIWELPVVFLCENNFYASTTNIALMMAVPRVVDRSAAYAMPGALVDGNDVVAVHAAVLEAVGRARAGEGPTLVECLTYRRGGHKRDQGDEYRPRDEVDTWLALDPIPRFERRLSAEGVVSDAELKAEADSVARRLDAVVERALAAPPARPLSLDVR